MTLEEVLRGDGEESGFVGGPTPHESMSDSPRRISSSFRRANSSPGLPEQLLPSARPQADLRRPGSRFPTSPRVQVSRVAVSRAQSRQRPQTALTIVRGVWPFTGGRAEGLRIDPPLSPGARALIRAALFLAQFAEAGVFFPLAHLAGLLVMGAPARLFQDPIAHDELVEALQRDFEGLILTNKYLSQCGTYRPFSRVCRRRGRPTLPLSCIYRVSRATRTDRVRARPVLGGLQHEFARAL